MAITLVGSVETATGNNQASLELTKPSGATEGDVAIILAGQDGNTSDNFALPSGFTEVENSIFFTDSIIVVAYKVLGSSEPSSYTITTDDGEGQAAAIMVFRGVDGSNPLDVGHSFNTADSTTPTASSITTVNNGCALIAMCANESGAASPLTPPSGMTELTDLSTGSGTTDIAISAAWETQSSAGSTGDKTFTSSDEDTWGAVLIALRLGSTSLSGDITGEKGSISGNIGIVNTLHITGEKGTLESVGAVIGSGSDGSATTEEITSGSSWMVPSDWNDNDNSIECIGGGGGGADGGGGGGGGAYAQIINQALTPSTSINFSLGAGGSAGNAGGDTWFDSTSTVLAKGGSGASGNTAGVGGSAGSSVGDTTRRGGNGADGTTDGGGGGGAAGDTASGGDASNTSGGDGNGGSGGAGATTLGNDGGDGSEFGTTGAGGGGAGTSQGGFGANSSPAGNGGFYGGGGAGSGDGGSFGGSPGAGGSGRQGLIVITYTPFSGAEGGAALYGDKGTLSGSATAELPWNSSISASSAASGQLFTKARPAASFSVNATSEGQIDRKIQPTADASATADATGDSVITRRPGAALSGMATASSDLTTRFAMSGSAAASANAAPVPIKYWANPTASMTGEALVGGLSGKITNLRGSVSAEAQAEGRADRAIPFAGDATGVAIAQGEQFASIPLVGSGLVEAEASGSTAIPVRGSATASAGIAIDSQDVTVIVGLEQSLEAVAITGSVEPTYSVRMQLSGGVDAQAATSGDIGKKVAFAGGVEARAITDGDAVRQVLPGGSADASAKSSGVAQRKLPFGGSLSASADTAITAEAMFAVAGSALANAGIQGDQSSRARLSAEIDATAAVSGDNSVAGKPPVSGSIAASADASGRLAFQAWPTTHLAAEARTSRPFTLLNQGIIDNPERLLLVDEESRAYLVPAGCRLFLVSAEPRLVYLASTSRTMKVPL